MPKKPAEFDEQATARIQANIGVWIRDRLDSSESRVHAAYCAGTMLQDVARATGYVTGWILEFNSLSRLLHIFFAVLQPAHSAGPTSTQRLATHRAPNCPSHLLTRRSLQHRDLTRPHLFWHNHVANRFLSCQYCSGGYCLGGSHAIVETFGRIYNPYSRKSDAFQSGQAEGLF
jgi:hypothetical protein